MSSEAVKDLRERAGLAQEEMAKRMGVKLEDYLALESGTRSFNRLHTFAYERLGLLLAAEKKDADLAPPAVRRAALRLAEVVLQQGPARRSTTNRL